MLVLLALTSGVAALTLSSRQQVNSLSTTTVQFPNGTLANVQARLATAATHSWEIGTQTQALLEWEWPSLSVFGASAIPDPVYKGTANASDVFTIVTRVLTARTAKQNTFFLDGAAGDPASVGVATLLANWTNPASTLASNTSQAPTDQLNFLLQTVPRAANGAISQRTNEVQLWADYMSMVPPFIAYYGAVTKNVTLLTTAYNQIAYYRETLLDPSGSGLWRHILLGSYQDEGLWATGNAWAAHGILRVLSTIAASPSAPKLLKEQLQLRDWAFEIISNAWKLQQPSGALLNYLNGNGTAASIFEDSSATALIAAATFRLAVILPSYNATITKGSVFNKVVVDIAPALKARQYIISQISAEGWLQNVVDPQDWHQKGENSPEGQAFVLMMEAAYRDWTIAAKAAKEQSLAYGAVEVSGTVA